MSNTLMRRLARDGYIGLVVGFTVLRLFQVEPWDQAVDAYAYWSTRDGSFYDGTGAGVIGAYVYSPAFAQLLAPAVLLPWAWFITGWTMLLFVVYWALTRRLALPLLLFLPFPFEIISGNVHLLYAGAIVVGFRWPAAWALMALTKVTPAVGILWFAARREWRALALALLATGAVTGASFALDPGAWRAWIDILQLSSSTPHGTVGWFLPVPLVVRLPVAAVTVVFAALTDRRWLLPVAVTLALPVIWLNSLAILAACVPLRHRAEATNDGGVTTAVVGATATNDAPAEG